MDIVVMAHPAKKVVFARVRADLRPIVLWRGAEYDAVGDWTLSQAIARAHEVMATTNLEDLVVT